MSTVLILNPEFKDGRALYICDGANYIPVHYRILEPQEPVAEYSGVMVEWAKGYQAQCGDKYYLHPYAAPVVPAKLDFDLINSIADNEGINRISLSHAIRKYLARPSPQSESSDHE